MRRPASGIRDRAGDRALCRLKAFLEGRARAIRIKGHDAVPVLSRIPAVILLGCQTCAPDCPVPEYRVIVTVLGFPVGRDFGAGHGGSGYRMLGDKRLAFGLAIYRGGQDMEIIVEIEGQETNPFGEWGVASQVGPGCH